MNYLERFVKRHEMKGESATEAQINQSIRSFERDFDTSPSHYFIEVDGESVDAIVNKTNNYDEKLINFRNSFTPVSGSVITFEGEDYLLMETDKDEIYRFGVMKKCNHAITIKTDKQREFVGYDNNNRPIYDYVFNEVKVPCVITSKYYSTNDNAQLPLPEGKISLFMKYIPESKNNNMKINEEFILFDKRYVIADMDLTQVENEQGIVEVVMERKVSLRSDE